jgi:hypothetical protein
MYRPLYSFAGSIREAVLTYRVAAGISASEQEAMRFALKPAVLEAVTSVSLLFFYLQNLYENRLTRFVCS